MLSAFFMTFGNAPMLPGSVHPLPFRLRAFWLSAALAAFAGLFATCSPASGQPLAWTRLIPTTNHVAAFDSVRGVVVAFGPPSFGNAAHETWEWNGTSGAWTQRTVAGPNPANVGAIAFDSVRNVTVMRSGTQTWEWNGTGWIQRTVVGLVPPTGGKMAFDSARGVMVLFVGS